MGYVQESRDILTGFQWACLDNDNDNDNVDLIKRQN